ncbi:hypothetical protein PBY51_001181 [Eleginops maclovinus]|uniref:CHHC U11-48K-type domain-containing protein n=1 Tax=Eleginops maclovinus TaxID=56733 RepID=A0AAN8AIS8_ELEMC|nr:hypothetical protein PBY51_001181 [Eleginops maclovinus]
MANISYGSMSGACRTAAAGRAESDTERSKRGNLNPDALQQCPFDKNHLIRVCRFPYHLIKCRKNHPELADKLKTCPFNARHLLPQSELMFHTENCEDRISVDNENCGSTDRLHNPQVPVSTWVNPDMSEDWDDEADDAAPAFVWGVNTVGDPHLELSLSNCLGQSSRTPNILPWSGP